MARWVVGAIRICVCGPDDELREWIVEELRLMTWVGALELESIASPAEVPPRHDLLILGADGLPELEVEQAARDRTAPLILIGSARVPADRVLGPRLTSGELKRAIRELVVGSLASSRGELVR